MSWDSKGHPVGGRDYCRSGRINRRTVKKNGGTGPYAEIAALLDKLQRQQREAERQAWLNEKQRVASAEARLAEFCLWTNLLAEAALLLSGYHHHKGQWRKRRRDHGRTGHRTAGTAAGDAARHHQVESDIESDVESDVAANPAAQAAG